MIMEEGKSKKLYVVVSQTGTVLSRILKVITKKEYNHVSLSLDESLEPMYAFARRWAYIPFYGAFVKESRFRGTFYRFSGTKAIVLAVSVSEEQYEKAKEKLEKTYEERKKYGYNYLALFFGLFGKAHRAKNRYYCSEFAREVLIEAGIVEKDFFGEIVYPQEFLALPHAERVYEGLLREYGEQKELTPLKGGASAGVAGSDETVRVR